MEKWKIKTVEYNILVRILISLNWIYILKIIKDKIVSIYYRGNSVHANKTVVCLDTFQIVIKANICLR